MLLWTESLTHIANRRRPRVIVRSNNGLSESLYIKKTLCWSWRYYTKCWFWIFSAVIGSIAVLQFRHEASRCLHRLLLGFLVCKKSLPKVSLPVLITACAGNAATTDPVLLPIWLKNLLLLISWLATSSYEAPSLVDHILLRTLHVNILQQSATIPIITNILNSYYRLPYTTTIASTRKYERSRRVSY